MSIKQVLNISLTFIIWGTASLSCSKDSGGGQLPSPPQEEKNRSLETTLKEADWEIEQLASGIQWRYFHFPDIMGSQQSISVFEIDPNTVHFDIDHVTSGFLKTSEAGLRSNAEVAFNGSYFDTTNGGSTVFYKKNGNIINETRSGFTYYRENAALAINGNKINIHKKPGGGWNSITAPIVLAGGPLLIYEGKEVTQVNQVFNTNRHPRTAIGVTASGKVIMVVVDGRSSQSHGLSTMDLSSLMYALGCVEAMNLDGGGSSTAWVRDKGVVNFPTDNGNFDHEGERGVATVITVSLP